jgi:hypothetical protein
MHYKRKKRHGDPNILVRAKRTVHHIQRDGYWDVDAGHGQFTKVSNADFHRIEHIKWHVAYNGYVHGYDSSTGRQVLLHRVIMNTPKGMQTDHISGDKKDNRRCNLRICTQYQNKANSKARKGRRYKGVTWCPLNKRWRSRIRIGTRLYDFGLFSVAEDAARAYDAKAKEEYGEFARLNVIE